MIRGAAGFVLAILVSLAAACGGAPPSGPSPSPAITVGLAVRDNTYEPQAIQIPAGTPFAIEFTNNDSVPHNVTIQGTGTRPGEIFSGPGERLYVFPALAAGNYRLVCDVHPDMTGELQVE